MLLNQMGERVEYENWLLHVIRNRWKLENMNEKLITLFDVSDVLQAVYKSFLPRKSMAPGM